MDGIPCRTPECPNVAFESSPSYPYCGKCADTRAALEQARITLKAVREGEEAMLPTDDRAGVARRPAPYDGVLVTAPSGTEFLDAGRLERELRRIGRAGAEPGPRPRKERRVI